MSRVRKKVTDQTTPISTSKEGLHSLFLQLPTRRPSDIRGIWHSRDPGAGLASFTYSGEELKSLEEGVTSSPPPRNRNSNNVDDDVVGVPLPTSLAL